MELTNPLNLTILNAADYTTGGNWDFYEQDHVDEIAESMRRNGWQGAPLVVLPNYAVSYTGTHRLRAAEAAELDEVPAVDLAELFTACGLDLTTICDEHDLGLLSDRMEIVDHLPENIRIAYTLNDIEG